MHLRAGAPLHRDGRGVDESFFLMDVAHFVAGARLYRESTGRKPLSRQLAMLGLRSCCYLDLLMQRVRKGL